MSDKSTAVSSGLVAIAAFTEWMILSGPAGAAPCCSLSSSKILAKTLQSAYAFTIRTMVFAMATGLMPPSFLGSSTSSSYDKASSSVPSTSAFMILSIIFAMNAINCIVLRL